MSKNFDPNQNHYFYNNKKNSIPLVFIHGVGLDHRMWDDQIDHLNEFSILTYDLIGHGKTPCNKEKITLNDFSNQLLEILDHLKLAISDSSSGIYHIKQVKYLKAAHKEINDIEVNLIELEIVAEKLKQTQENISMILDNNDDDRVLSGIFSNFCIGK